MWIQSLDWEDPLEKEMAIHSSILAWEMPWTEEPGGLHSMHLIKLLLIHQGPPFLSASSIRSPIHIITLTHMELPSARYRDQRGAISLP